MDCQLFSSPFYIIYMRDYGLNLLLSDKTQQ